MAERLVGIAFLSVFFLPIESVAQDSLATIYFYRAKQSGSSMRYVLTEDKTQVGRMKPGSVAVYRCKPGSHSFSASGKTSSVFQMAVDPGKEYYVDCFVKSNQPTFRIATSGESRRAIAKIDKEVSRNIAPVIITTSPDTVEAFRHMFKRKRGWGIGFVAIGAVFTPVLIVGLINYEPQIITSDNNGGGPVVTTTIDESPSYITAIFNGVTVTTAGAILWSKHTPRKLTVLLENKAEGKPFPPKMLRQLKPKDFGSR